MRSKGLAIQQRASREQNMQLVSMPRLSGMGQANVLPMPRSLGELAGFASGGIEPHPFFHTLTIIIPVYNEINTVMAMLEKVLLQDTTPLAKEIFVVDDFSTDGTREALQGVDWNEFCEDSRDCVHVLLHDSNRGKGAAVRTALEQAKGELVLVQDADLEYDPADYPALLRPLLDGHADAVFGNRFHPGAHRVPRYYRFLLNRMFSILCNMLTSLALNDVTACYKVLRRDTLDTLKLESNRFSMETELTVKLARTNARIYEVPIVYHGRTYAEGKKISWVDGLAAAYHLFRYRFF